MVCSPEGDKLDGFASVVLLEVLSTEVELFRVLDVRFPLAGGAPEEVDVRLVSCGWTDAEAAIFVSFSIGGAVETPQVLMI